jgi:hypothetical protein
MHAISEYSQQDRVIYSKMWRAGRSSGSILLDMASRAELPMQLMSLIVRQFPSWIAVATTEEGGWKIAEINFDSLDPAIDILKDCIIFENNTARLLPCWALDTIVSLIRIWLSNLPFLKKQLKTSLKSYGSVLDLGIQRSEKLLDSKKLKKPIQSQWYSWL